MRTRHRSVTASTIAAFALLSGCADRIDDHGGRAGDVTTPGSSATSTPDPLESHRLDCAGGRSTTWSTDPGKPPPNTTVADAIERYPGAEVIEQSEASARAVVRGADGRVVSTLFLVRWRGDTGGWFVESGSDCR